MKKLLKYLLGWSPKPPPPQRRVLPAHEVALKQAVARRRSEKATNGSPAKETAERPPPVVAEGAESNIETAESNSAGDLQSPPAGKRRQKRNAAKRQSADADADVGSGRKKEKKKRARKRA